MMKRCFHILLLLLLLSGTALQAAVRINEFLFYSGLANDEDHEFIELYNDGPGAVELLGWSLESSIAAPITNNSSYVLAAGDYVVIYPGNPANPVSNSVSLGLDSEYLDNHGGSILLRDDQGIPQDYVAYGSYVASPPAPLSFPTPILLDYWQAGDSLAFIGLDPDDPCQWINRRASNISPGGQNTRQPDPGIPYGTIAPTSYSACETITVPIVISYDLQETPLYKTRVDFELPAGFLFVEAPGAVFNDGTRTISWNIGVLPGHFDVYAVIKPDCSVNSGISPVRRSPSALRAASIKTPSTRSLPPTTPRPSAYSSRSWKSMSASSTAVLAPL
ncbi:MAG: lamin tail domain-containing protein [Lentisphaeria bacterium]